ncbi:MAG TPA: ornithine cyclodeaminase family protein [Usitatibacter sp.]|jgi:ornithine cyclodeaminase|nr:ornithine cyclodeaminase family protein [Usitatibacter sp.]
MRHLTDDDVERALAGADIEAALRAAFVDLALGRAAQQPRMRTEAGGVKLSTLGGVVPSQGVAGAKVYTTIAGRFDFVIVLFSTADGRPIATLEANAVTRRRTAAVSLVAARAARLGDVSSIVVFGTGVQAKAHAEAFTQAYPGAHLRMLGRPELAQAREALAAAQVVVTATRSTEPLFDGAWLAPGTFVAAVGSSRPDTRELDDTAFARAASVIVEWKPQALAEAGDLIRLAPPLRARLRIVELGEVLAGQARARTSPGDIVVFKSVGVGIEDVVVAGLACGKAPESPVHLR